MPRAKQPSSLPSQVEDSFNSLLQNAADIAVAVGAGVEDGQEIIRTTVEKQKWLCSSLETSKLNLDTNLCHHDDDDEDLSIRVATEQPEWLCSSLETSVNLKANLCHDDDDLSFVFSSSIEDEEDDLSADSSYYNGNANGNENEDCSALASDLLSPAQIAEAVMKLTGTNKASKDGTGGNRDLEQKVPLSTQIAEVIMAQQKSLRIPSKRATASAAKVGPTLSGSSDDALIGIEQRTSPPIQPVGPTLSGSSDDAIIGIEQRTSPPIQPEEGIQDSLMNTTNCCDGTNTTLVIKQDREEGYMRIIEAFYTRVQCGAPIRKVVTSAKDVVRLWSQDNDIIKVAVANETLEQLDTFIELEYHDEPAEDELHEECHETSSGQVHEKDKAVFAIAEDIIYEMLARHNQMMGNDSNIDNNAGNGAIVFPTKIKRKKSDSSSSKSGICLLPSVREDEESDFSNLDKNFPEGDPSESGSPEAGNFENEAKEKELIDAEPAETDARNDEECEDESFEKSEPLEKEAPEAEEAPREAAPKKETLERESPEEEFNEEEEELSNKESFKEKKDSLFYVSKCGGSIGEGLVLPDGREKEQKSFIFKEAGASIDNCSTDNSTGTWDASYIPWDTPNAPMKEHQHDADWYFTGFDSNITNAPKTDEERSKTPNTEASSNSESSTGTNNTTRKVSELIAKWEPGDSQPSGTPKIITTKIVSKHIARWETGLQPKQQNTGGNVTIRKDCINCIQTKNGLSRERESQVSGLDRGMMQKNIFYEMNRFNFGLYHQDGRSLPETMSLLHECAILIQTKWRGYIGELEFLSQRQAAILIQREFRSHFYLKQGRALPPLGTEFSRPREDDKVPTEQQKLHSLISTVRNFKGADHIEGCKEIKRMLEEMRVQRSESQRPCQDLISRHGTTITRIEI